MNILNKSIRIINYENGSITPREALVTFNEYIDELILHINTNNSIRQFKTQSANSEVISVILKILANRDNSDYVAEHHSVIATRLLSKEMETQGRVGPMNINVKKGSLIQALLYDEVTDTYKYLLAKVEHSDFVDDTDFSFRTGFSKDKKTIWKSCLFDLINPEADVFNAKIYSDTKAKYWSHDFLELEEVITDEKNTISAFSAIDETLNRNVKRSAPQDYTILRNAFIKYLRGHEHIDYGEMIGYVLDDYLLTDLTTEKYHDLKEKFNELPEKKKFERQFDSVPSAITAKIKKAYEISDGIELNIKKEIENIRETIVAYSDPDGTRYIKIKTDNDETYRLFVHE